MVYSGQSSVHSATVQVQTVVSQFHFAAAGQVPTLPGTPGTLGCQDVSCVFSLPCEPPLKRTALSEAKILASFHPYPFHPCRRPLSVHFASNATGLSTPTSISTSLVSQFTFQSPSPRRPPRTSVTIAYPPGGFFISAHSPRRADAFATQHLPRIHFPKGRWAD